MPQYKTGSIITENESNVIFGLDTEWMYEVSPGDLFIADGDEIIYQIDSVISNNEIHLQTTYKGEIGVNTYSITRDFTPVVKLPIIYKNDKSTRVLLKYSIVKLEDARGEKWSVADSEDSIILKLTDSIITNLEYAAANAEQDFTLYEDILNIITNIDLPQTMGI